MNITKRYFKVVGEGLVQLESILDERAIRKSEANWLAQENGFECVAIRNGKFDRVAGFVMPHDAEPPESKAWKATDKLEDGRYVYRPKLTSKARRALGQKISEICIPGRLEFLDLFGLKGWEIIETEGRGIRFYKATCGQLAGHWIVIVPESEDKDAERFAGHDWLHEITLADFRELQAQDERQKEKETAQ